MLPQEKMLKITATHFNVILVPYIQYACAQIVSFLNTCGHIDIHILCFTKIKKKKQKIVANNRGNGLSLHNNAKSEAIRST